MSDRSLATRVVVSYGRTDGRVRDALSADRYVDYLRRAHAGPVAVGDDWAEFVSRGCGATRDVTLRVESVDGGEEIGEETAFSFEPRG